MRRDNSVFLIVSAVFVIIASWSYCYVYGFGGYKSKVADLENIKSEVQSARDKYDSLVDTKTTIEKNQALIENALVAIPEDTDAENLISELEQITREQGLSVASFMISDSSENGNTSDIGFSVKGSFEAIGSLIKSIEKDIKIMEIDSLTLSTDESDISATFGLKTFKRSQ